MGADETNRVGVAVALLLLVEVGENLSEDLFSGWRRSQLCTNH
jgi:hypothetical protein